MRIRLLFALCLLGTAIPASSAAQTFLPNVDTRNLAVGASYTWNNVAWDATNAAASVIVKATATSGPRVQKMQIYKTFLGSGYSNITDPAFISYSGVVAGQDLPSWRMLGNGGVMTADLTFSSPLTKFDLILSDIDDKDVMKFRGFDANGSVLNSANWTRILSGDLTSDGTGPDGSTAQPNTTVPLVSSTASQITLTSSTRGGYRDYSIFRYDGPAMIRLEIIADVTLSSETSHSYFALRSVPDQHQEM